MNLSDAENQSKSADNLESWTNSELASANPPLLCIAVEYVNNSKASNPPSIPTTRATTEMYTDYITPQLSPLDPNLSSAARYSPISVQYQDESNFPIIIHQYVTQETNDQEAFVNQGSDLENISPMLCNNLQSDDQKYLQIMDNCESELQLSEVKDQNQEVELLITDLSTGISYSVNAQELLVEPCSEGNQPLLGSATSNALLESDMFSLNGDNMQINQDTNTIEVNEEMLKECFGSCTGAEEGRVHTRRNCINQNNEEDVSFVYSIEDKPILSRARASLPESYLSIMTFDNENGIVAKKKIPKRTQFGPLQGILNMQNNISLESIKFLMIIKGSIYTVDVSDENHSNWMGFVRRASTYEEQNLILTQEGNGLYFTTIRNILPKEELRVGYSKSYASQFNLSILKPVDKKSWPCYECSERFGTSEELQTHFYMHDDEKNENVKPKKKLRKATTMARKSQIDIAECNSCHKLFSAGAGYGLLKSHLMKKHKAQRGEKIGDQFTVFKCFQCLVCDARFKLETLLNIHKLEHDPDLPLEQPNHVCPQCQRKFPTRKQLVLHVPTHALPDIVFKDDSVKCPVCHKFFSHSVRLQTHMLCHGSEESKPLQCKVCKKRFLTVSALSFHTKMHMKGEKLFECPICKERFDHVLKLRLHVPSHATNNTYTCPHCKKVFSKYSIIRKHIRFHSEKKYNCSECSKAFPTMDNLKKHMLRHSDHREFLCADCGKQFKRKDKLKEHIKKLHLQACSSRVVKERAATASKEPTDFHRFIYKCHTCLLGFKRRGMLVNHLAKRHPDIRPDSVPELNLPILQTTKEYFCQFCEKVYKSSSKRKNHILKNHPGAPLPSDNGQKLSTPPTSFTTSGSITTQPKKCQWCHRQYARNGKLLQHIRKAHRSKIEEDNSSHKENLDDNNVKVENRSAALLEKIASELVKVDNNAAFTITSAEEYPDVFQKNQITTTDGNITEITPVAMEGLIDEDSKYCHLSIDENGELENPNVQLYHLLTTTNNGIIPPR